MTQLLYRTVVWGEFGSKVRINVWHASTGYRSKYSVTEVQFNDSVGHCNKNSSQLRSRDKNFTKGAQSCKDGKTEGR